MNAKHLTRKDLSAIVPQYPSNFIHKKLAFTLAEVLITLGIIGVVAALTLPTLIQKYKKQVTVNQLKKAYSVMGQVSQKAVADNGPIGFADGAKLNKEDVKNFFDTYWLQYFNGVQVSPDNKAVILNDKAECTNCYYYFNGQLCTTSIMSSYSQGRIFFSTSDGVTYYINIMKWANPKVDDNGNIIGSDGAVYSSVQNVLLDVNGIKPPNIFGKDVFYFVVDFDNGFVKPVGYNYSPKAIDNDCKSTGSCQYGAAKIIRDGWKINY